MLVLSRGPGETLLIGDIEFKVLEVRGNKVRLGVTAPREIQVLRGELRRSNKNTATKPLTTTIPVRTIAHTTNDTTQEPNNVAADH